MPEIDKADGTPSAAEQAEKRIEKPIGLCVASAGLHAASTHRKKRSFRNKGSRYLRDGLERLFVVLMGLERVI